MEAGTEKAQLHLPSFWNWLSEGWTAGHACWKIMPGSFPSLEWGMGAQDSRYIALSLGGPQQHPWAGLPGASSPVLHPSSKHHLLHHGDSVPPRCSFQALWGLGQAQQVLFSIAPSPAIIPMFWGHPSCNGVMGVGIPSHTAAATSGCFAHGQPKVEEKRVSACFGSQSSMRLPT